MKLKILSWNIWIDGHFDQISDFLAQTDADIIGLQEVKDDDQARDVISYLKALGYQHSFSPIEKTWKGKVYRDGCAVFSKFPIQTSVTHILSTEDSRIAIQADILVNNVLLHVFSTHLIHTHQQESETQSKQVETLVSLVPSKHSIVMGDFNSTPESTVVKKMEEAMNNTDPSDTPTWSVYPEGCSTCLPRSISTRLDYIFTSKDLSTLNPQVGHSKGSDHLPIAVDVEIQ